MTTSAQCIAAGEDEWIGPRKQLSEEHWQTECIVARTQLVEAKDELKEVTRKYDDLYDKYVDECKYTGQLRRQLTGAHNDLAEAQQEIDALQSRLAELERTAEPASPQSISDAHPLSLSVPVQPVPVSLSDGGPRSMTIE